MKCFLLCVLSGCCLVLGGCGSSDRSSVTGTVTLDGQPLEKGSINLMPMPGTKSPTAGAQIVDGNFTVAAKGGTFAGKFRVEITASRPSGKKIPHPMTGEMIEATEQFLPAKYNKQSELQVEITEGTNQLEFPLTSK